MTKENISLIIAQFVNRAVEMNLIDSMDKIYLRNRLLDALNQDDYIEPETLGELPDLLDSMDKIVDYAVNYGIIEDYQYQKEIFEAKLMDLITPLPSVVNGTFWEKYDEDPKEATEYLYQLSKENDYIKTRNIAKNIFFKTSSPYGDLEITINLSKPEKDPKEIAAAVKQKTSMHYPKCALCLENEGYEGHANHAARANHRIVRMDINDEIYGMQYSPYLYYNEHSIFLNKEHKPMVIDQNSIENLLEIIDLLPHYFVGSNADLPRVGGSILTHDHYQGGYYQFPIEAAKVIETVDLNAHPNVKTSLLQWPLSVIRLQAESKRDLVEAVTDIMIAWEQYSDESRGIISHTNETRHNTITPIARFNEGLYEMDVVLRNNRTTEEFPDGIFHPHPDVQHIKKENIGLIEVMGLAILPPRLLEELTELEEFLLSKRSLNEVAEVHQPWAKELKVEAEGLEKDSLSEFIRQRVGDKFTRVLEDAGVFKQTEDGIEGFERFIDMLNSEN